MTDSFLLKALFVSLTVHTAILAALFISRMHDPLYNSIHQNRIEISYQPSLHHTVDIKEHPIKPTQRLDLGDDHLSDGNIPVSLVKNKPALPFGMLYEDQKPQRLSVMELSHRISIMPISSEKINNPVYAAYNEMVRDRIKEKVYENYDKMEAGNVYLTFLLDHNGNLKEARVVPEKTDASQHLQDLALKSLTDASPFPQFLKGMNLWEYPFNIEIQYHVSDDQ